MDPTPDAPTYDGKVNMLGGPADGTECAAINYSVGAIIRSLISFKDGLWQEALYKLEADGTARFTGEITATKLKPVE